MRFQIEPATVQFQEDGGPRSLRYGDVYHPRAGAIEQASAVFLQGNGLPTRWAGKNRFTILETGFGLGNNFLATWLAWRADPQRPQRLFYVSIEGHPLLPDDARCTHAVHRGSAVEALSAQLLQQWPPCSPDLHRVSFEAGQVVLLVAHGEISTALRECRLLADAVFLDGFSPDRNPAMWTPRVFKALGRVCAPDATAATWSSAAIVRQGLRLAGFNARLHPGFAGKRQMTVATREAMTTAPRTAPNSMPDAMPATRRPQGQRQPPAWPAVASWQPGHEPPVIVGGGLAGAACAWALAQAGIPSVVLDRAPHPASGASGNPAGLFHGVLHAEDGAHARWSRAAAWMAASVYGQAISAGHATGSVEGLLRREDRLQPPQMTALCRELRLPPAYVQPLADDLVAAWAGIRPARAAGWWLYPRGGWVDPGAWVRWALGHPLIHFRAQVSVTALRRGSSAHRPDQRSGSADVHSPNSPTLGIPPIWELLDATGSPIIRSSHVIICAAWETLALLPEHLTPHWPLERQRGQISRIPADMPHLPRLPHLQRPVSGTGYALSLPNGDLLCGATSDQSDSDPLVRRADHQRNLERLKGLTGGWPFAANEAGIDALLDRMQGRVGWRAQADDRLPVVGPCPAWTHGSPASTDGNRHLTRLREHPIEPGLFLATGLGSRGITWAPLIGQVLAAWITGDPAPLPASLLEAVDPRRFSLRQARRVKTP